MTVYDQDVCLLSWKVEEVHDEEVVVPICQCVVNVHVRTPTIQKKMKLSRYTIIKWSETIFPCVMFKFYLYYYLLSQNSVSFALARRTGRINQCQLITIYYDIMITYVKGACLWHG